MSSLPQWLAPPSWLGGGGGGTDNNNLNKNSSAAKDDDEAVHRRRLSQILRYIAQMHHSLQAENGPSFVQDGGRLSRPPSDFFQHESHHNDEGAATSSWILFTTADFRHLLAAQQASMGSTTAEGGGGGAPVFANPPFSFYAAASSSSTGAASSPSSRKRSLTGMLKDYTSGASASVSASTNKNSASSMATPVQPADGKVCWMRLTRLTHATASSRPDDLLQSTAVQVYLNDWLQNVPDARSIHDLLTLERLSVAPKLPPMHRNRTVVQAFVRQYRKYLRRKMVMDILEPIYNHLFEWIQSSPADEELVFGLGHARWFNASTSTWLSSPVLEILVEPEVSRVDGALLLRPRDHTGVALHRPLVMATVAESRPHTMAALHQTVANVEPRTLSPGQPSTYASLLQEIALQVASDASFQSSAASRATADPTKLIISEDWCLFRRPKPVSVWARDATAFSDSILASAASGAKNGSAELPLATWALTAGPSAVEAKRLERLQETQKKSGTNVVSHGETNTKKNWWPNRMSSSAPTPTTSPTPEPQPLFPLPASVPQAKIARLLLHEQHSAVVCEGPPGSGKSHTICNIVCAYLCQGKRVLVTSKNAHALSVLRNRLPGTVRDLCVDISMSELSGMRQLQQTVERLANRVSMVSGELEASKCAFLQEKISQLETDIADLDEKITQQSSTVRELLLQSQGQRFSSLALDLIENVPWLMRTLATWNIKEVKSLRDTVRHLVLEDSDLVHRVTGFESPPPVALVNKVAARAGESWSSFTTSTKAVAAALPVVGSLTGLKEQEDRTETALNALLLAGARPLTRADWTVVVRGLRHAQAFHKFEHTVWKMHEYKDAWPAFANVSENTALRDLAEQMDKMVEMKTLAMSLNVTEEVEAAKQCRSYDMQRSILVAHRQKMAEELVDATLLVELSRAFSAEAQSALIRFAQIAGRARFGRSSSSLKMTQRQRRRRQEYLSAFDQCCRFIPCWILTTSQISDYLPAEGLFDLVIVDEASQSDVTVLPGMLRGKQWLIVGDSKQVSPTESFISEEQIYGLQAALPESPLRDSLLPGHSFFDLCSQAFPGGRVVLSEHFRCSEELISFSNEHFYDGQLVPLRLPTKSERLSPCLIDVKTNGVKSGKVNALEVQKIVELIVEIVDDGQKNGCPRSIGVISLIGDDQSRTIRARLLDAIGPHAMSRHNILIGDPPSFQGAERDIIFLTVVASPGSVPTQNQLMHYQRLNVAMSRARDRCYLIRSIEPHDIPNTEDAKLLLLNFFLADRTEESSDNDVMGISRNRYDRMLAGFLEERGFKVRPMGRVWQHGLCIENEFSDARAAVLVDCVGEPVHEWTQSYSQQRAIERVGWKCIRIDAVSLVNDFHGTLQNLVNFLEKCGVQEQKILYDELEDEIVVSEEDQDNNAAVDDHPAALNREIDNGIEDRGDIEDDPVVMQHALEEEGVYVISSDEEGGKDEGVLPREPDPIPDAVGSNPIDRAEKFGEVVVDLGFLRDGPTETDNEDFVAKAKARAMGSEASQEEEYEGDGSKVGEVARKKRRRRSQKLAKYARDPRWHPNQEEESKDLEDTDSDAMEEDEEKDDERK